MVPKIWPIICFYKNWSLFFIFHFFVLDGFSHFLDIPDNMELEERSTHQATHCTFPQKSGLPEVSPREIWMAISTPQKLTNLP